MVKYKYDAWGNHKVLNASGVEITDAAHIGNINPFRYRSYYFDVNSGLYYLKSRFYDPETGRFLNADTIDYLEPDSINGLNLYAYCRNNPVMCVDPSGHMPKWLSTTLKIIGGVAIIAGCVVGSILTGGALSVVLAGAAIGAAAGGIGAGISTVISGGDIHDFANAFLMSTVTGAISGAVAAGPWGVVAQMGVNAALGAANYYGTQKLNGENVTLGGLIINAGIGALCGKIGQNGWMQEVPVALFAAAGLKNALKHIVTLVGTEALLRMAIPAVVLGGIGGGLYARISEHYNPSGDFMGF